MKFHPDRNPDDHQREINSKKLMKLMRFYPTIKNVRPMINMVMQVSINSMAAVVARVISVIFFGDVFGDIFGGGRGGRGGPSRDQITLHA